MHTSSILLDYQSSTPCHEEVIEVMKPFWIEIFSNPSSKSNLASISANAALEVSREKITNELKLKNKKIIFTSGATESNNLALLGYARSFYNQNGSFGHIITLKTEHQAVLEPIRQLQKEGFTVSEISPESDGLISIDKLLNAIKSDTFLISVMLANNEIGVIQPLNSIYEICQAKHIVLHTDAAQCPGYLPINYFNSIANMITLSSHKIYGPKGVGLLILDKNIEIKPILFGGGQEFGLRAGTIPLPLIVGFSKAIELAVKNQKRNSFQLSLHRDNLLNGLLANDSQIYINGSMVSRLPHNLNVTFPGISGSKLHKHLKSKIICSSGSACSNGKPSHVLTSIGRSFNEAESSIRLSIGLMTTRNEITSAISIINNVVSNLRQ